MTKEWRVGFCEAALGTFYVELGARNALRVVLDQGAVALPVRLRIRELLTCGKVRLRVTQLGDFLEALIPCGSFLMC